MSFSVIRAAIADACESVGLLAHSYITDDITTPAAVIRMDRVQYDLTFGRGADQIDLTVTVVADRTDEQGAQAFLDDLIDPASSSLLKTVLEDSDTVAAAGVHYIRVREASAVQQLRYGAVDYLSVDLTIEVVV